ncbi:5'-nucleotidase [Corynebacterium meridianum]|uniref:5'-nucleotidase n=1 Tax=Corynebacterium meridianum TaxID=2765363 RepID=A0A934I4Y2_9CORY|nr:5'-nucleotidase [Corynebacterium meridianum]
MPYDLESKLCVGIASSALFDLRESSDVFEKQGEEAYRAFQEERLDVPLAPGRAYPFVKRLLGLNRQGLSKEPVVEVFVMSKNSPESGLRVMRSIKTLGLPISRAIFSSGNSPFRYMDALSMSLFLSADEKDVKSAIRRGLPAGTVLDSTMQDDGNDDLRIAFDFDGVLSDDSAEQYYQQTNLFDYLKHEDELKENAIGSGPLSHFLADINRIQKLERTKRKQSDAYTPKLEVSLITARNAPAHERAVNSLRHWGVSVDNAFFLGGVDKGLIVSELQPHIYFDDQRTHLDSTSRYVPSVHIPFGAINDNGEIDQAASR